MPVKVLQINVILISIFYNKLLSELKFHIMAMRRPRVKPLANLSTKRKVKKIEGTDSEILVSSEQTPQIIENVVNTKVPSVEEPSARIQPKTNEAPPSNSREESTSEAHVQSLSIPEEQPSIESNKDSTAKNKSIVAESFDFKTPLSIEKKVNALPQNTVELLQHSEDEAAATSPVKPRQRIRPMPFFGLRRNSIQGSCDTEDEQRRNKSSLLSPHPVTTELKYNASNSNRKRTESTCSNVSESVLRESSRTRKVFASEESQRISAARKEFNTRFNGQAPEKSLLKMFDLIHYNPTTNPMKRRQKEDSISEKPQEPEVIEDEDITPPVDQTQPEDNQNTQDSTVSASMPVPQLKLGPNGELVLDEKSLVIETTAEKEARSTLANSTVIYVDSNTENNGFYKRHKRTKDWSAEETIKFYRCLHTVGTDFSLILTLFPTRTRREIKLKFKKEEKQNPALINKALLCPKAFDIEELKQELEKEEEEMQKAQEQWNEMKKKKFKRMRLSQKAAPLGKHSNKVDRSLRFGDIAYEYENYVLEHRAYRPRVKQHINYELIKNNVLLARKQRNNEKSVNDESMDYENTNSDFSQASDITKNTTVDESDSTEKDDPREYESTHHADNTETHSKFLLNVNNVLREIANGSLVIVASEDPNNPEKTINEIFVICKDSGELSEEPLDLPEDVMNCIISAVA